MLLISFLCLDFDFVSRLDHEMSLDTLHCAYAYALCRRHTFICRMGGSRMARREMASKIASVSVP